MGLTLSSRVTNPTSRWPLQARVGGVLALLICASVVLGSARVASAQSKRLVVLHCGGTDVPERLRAEVDRLLLENLTTRGRFASAYASPVPFEDIALAAGCNGREASCMQRIAATLETDSLLVRELVRDASGEIALTLTLHDGPGAELRHARAAVSEDDDVADEVLPTLVEQLYEAPSSARPNARSHRSRTGRLLGWSSLGVSAALLTVGLTMHALSRKDYDALAARSTDSPTEVDGALALEDRASRRSAVAKGMWIGAGTVGAAGLGALLWGYLRPSARESALRVGLAPSRSGAALAVSGSLGGGL